MENAPFQNQTAPHQSSVQKFLNSHGLSVVALLGIALILFLGKNALTGKNTISGQAADILNISASKTVSAQEIYPMFLCPCCGQPLDPKNICCPMAKERIEYIDSLIKIGGSKEEILLAYAQKYGLNSFADKNKQKKFQEELVKTAPSQRPIIILNPHSLDIGDVSEKKGLVSVFFTLKNEGQKDLIINKLDTSCGCTSAAIVYQNNEGPRFAMAGHDIKSPLDWSLTIPPGDQAQLKAYYDPAVHKDFRGPATREIYIYSNDPINFEKTVTVELNQID